MHYSQELKDSILRKILPPNNESITKIAKEEGIPEKSISIHHYDGSWCDAERLIRIKYKESLYDSLISEI